MGSSFKTSEEATKVDAFCTRQCLVRPDNRQSVCFWPINRIVNMIYVHDITCLVFKKVFLPSLMKKFECLHKQLASILPDRTIRSTNSYFTRLYGTTCLVIARGMHSHCCVLCTHCLELSARVVYSHLYLLVKLLSSDSNESSIVVFQ